MRKKVGIIFGIVAAIAIVGGVIVSNREPSSTPAQTLTVGALLPQTGSGAVFADYIQKGLNLVGCRNDFDRQLP